MAEGKLIITGKQITITLINIFKYEKTIYSIPAYLLLS